MDNMDIVVEEFMDSLERRVITIEEALNNIDKLVFTNIDLAEKLVRELREKTNLKGNVMVNYIANKIREKRFHDGMSDETRAKYEECLVAGQRALKNKNYNKALRVFSEGFQEIGHPLFMYYIGKSLFYLGENDKAADFFHKYIDMGSMNYGKANLYLYGLANKRGRARERRYRAALLYYAPTIFDSEEAYDTLVKKFKTPPNRERVLPSTVFIRRADDSRIGAASIADPGIAYVYAKKNRLES